MTLVQSEPKKIYVWNDEVKAVYVWTHKVRPAEIDPYWTYDFRWKTKAEVTADGWTLQSQANVNSNWLYSTTWWTNWLALPETVDSNTNKITVKWWIIYSSGFWLYLVNNSNGSQSWNYIWPWDTYNPCIQFYRAGAYTEYSAVMPSQADELTCVIDLVNERMEASFAGLWTTYTQWLNSSQVSGIRSNCKRFRIAFASANDYVQYIKFLVE